MDKLENFIYNQYKIDSDGKTVIGVLSNGDKFKIDIDDFSKVLKYKWYPSGKGESNKACVNSKGLYLHRYIMNEPKGFEVDHIDRDRMNNCKKNLRVCSHRENQCNQPLQCNNTSGVTGVRFFKARNKYVARIKCYGKDIHLGYYETKIEAIQARNEGAKILFGEFALLNDAPEAPKEIKDYVIRKCNDFLKKKYSLEVN